MAFSVSSPSSFAKCVEVYPWFLFSSVHTSFLPSLICVPGTLETFCSDGISTVVMFSVLVTLSTICPFSYRLQLVSNAEESISSSRKCSCRGGTDFGRLRSDHPPVQRFYFLQLRRYLYWRNRSENRLRPLASPVFRM